MKTYRALGYTYCADGAVVQYPEPSNIRRVSLDDPAVFVMTDLRSTLPYSIDLNTSLAAAHDKMIACGIRLLFVVDVEGLVRGVVSASDILGDRPMRYISYHGGLRESLTVKDVMTPMSLLEVILMTDVLRARVGNIAASLKLFSRHHLLAVEMEPGESAVIRGIFSASRVSRQLGEPVQITEPRAYFPLNPSMAAELD